ncbi:MAG: hypothetical protein LBJ62_11410 [Bifidobacteriaceae bacterium]|jgi:protein-tyrosine phosphatase|nr:hypothetical protein [Bifidobacteriaceae bacterium]
MPSPLRILAVCRGNVSRSPAAEYLLRASLDQRFALASAGIGARQVVGSGTDRWTAALLGKRGIDVSPHQARQLNGAIIGQAELILTMEQSQRSWVLAENPAAVKRTFTLVEFARLAVAVRGQNPQSVSDMIRRAADSRAVYRPVDEANDEIPDPHGRLIDDYRTAVSAIDQAVSVVVGELSRYPQLRSPVQAKPFAGFAF